MVTDVGKGWRGIYPVVWALLFAVRSLYFHPLRGWEEMTDLRGQGACSERQRSSPRLGLCGLQSPQGREPEHLEEMPLQRGVGGGVDCCWLILMHPL